MRRMLAAILFLVPFLLLPANRLQAGVNVWTPIGPDGGEITALEANPRRDNVVYAGTLGGVFRSTDHGGTWRLWSRGLQNRAISALAAAPSNGAVLYAGTWESGLFVTNDGGASWRPTPQPLLQTVLSLDVDPRDARKIWVGAAGGVYWSEDGGATWNAALSNLITRAIDIAVDPFDSDTVYVANEKLEEGVTGVLKTTDGGISWELLGNGIHFLYTEEQFRIALDPTTPGLVYASFRFSSLGFPLDLGTTYRSTDGGATWQATEAGFPIAVGRDGVVYAGDRRSDDHGQTWTPIAAPLHPGTQFQPARRYAVSPVTSTLWAGTLDDGVLRSQNRGASWRPASRGLHATSVTSLVIHPQRPRVMYAATFSHRGVRGFKTESFGAAWRAFDIPNPDFSVFSGPRLALSPVEPATVYIAWRHDNGLMRTDHGGAFWILLRGPGLPIDPFDPYQIVADPTAPGIVYLVGAGVGTPGEVCSVARSTDRGHTFECLPPFANGNGGVEAVDARLFADPARAGRLWVPVRRDLFWRSDDRGTTWTQVRPRGLERAGIPVWLAFDPTRPNRLYLTVDPRPGDRSDRVWRSDDGGLTWTSLGNTFPRLPAGIVLSLLVDPQQPSNLYAVVDGGVHMSRNGGRTWHPLVNGLPRQVTQLVMDPSNPRQLYALTSHLGIYAFTRQ